MWLQGAMEWWMMGFAQMKQTSPSPSAPSCSAGLGSDGFKPALLLLGAAVSADAGAGVVESAASAPPPPRPRPRVEALPPPPPPPRALESPRPRPLPPRPRPRPRWPSPLPLPDGELKLLETSPPAAAAPPPADAIGSCNAEECAPRCDCDSRCRLASRGPRYYVVTRRQQREPLTYGVKQWNV